MIYYLNVQDYKGHSRAKFAAFLIDCRKRLKIRLVRVSIDQDYHGQFGMVRKYAIKGRDDAWAAYNCAFNRHDLIEWLN